jgi:hypothetical protein
MLNVQHIKPGVSRKVAAEGEKQRVRVEAPTRAMQTDAPAAPAEKPKKSDRFSSFAAQLNG